LIWLYSRIDFPTLGFAVLGGIAGLIEPFRYIGPLIATAWTLHALLDIGDPPLIGALRADLPHLSRLRLLSGWLTRDSIGMDPLSGALFELLNSFLLLDANAVLLGARELRRHGPALQRVLAGAGEIDAAIAVASYRAGTPAWARPVPRSSGRPITIRDVRHPLLPEAVPNSIDLAPPHGILITGSNMSGKSTFLRSLGLAAVLSRTINTCTASAYEAPRLAVRSCLGRSDSVVEGRSYYLDEVRGVLGILQASQSPDTHLFLFDELFRGTNAVERIAASEATLRELANTSHVIITATHDMEVVSLLSGLFTPFHFADRMGPEGIRFDYRLTEGPGTTRNAIALLEFNGAPPSLIARARQLAAKLDAHADIGPRS
jgi:DNA mismatch repair ATPase MutS